MFGTTIVFTEPLAFRETKRRLYIRHLDINDSNDSEERTDSFDPITELMSKLPWIKKREDVVISRGYVPGGEVIAKDRLREWLTRHLEWVKHNGGSVDTPSPFVGEKISRKVANINALKNSHCLVLGCSRTNWVIRFIQREASQLLGLTIESDGILITKCTPSEFHLLEKRLMELKSGTVKEQDLKKMVRHRNTTVKLSEDWSKMSFALVTRVLDRSQGDPRAVLTVLTANQGRGIQALGEHILIDDNEMDKVRKVFGIGTFPTAFQMLFAITLEDQEAGYSQTGWRPLMFREIARQTVGIQSSGARQPKPRGNGRGKTASA